MGCKQDIKENSTIFDISIVLAVRYIHDSDSIVFGEIMTIHLAGLKTTRRIQLKPTNSEITDHGVMSRLRSFKDVFRFSKRVNLKQKTRTAFVSRVQGNKQK